MENSNINWDNVLKFYLDFIAKNGDEELKKRVLTLTGLSFTIDECGNPLIVFKRDVSWNFHFCSKKEHNFICSASENVEEEIANLVGFNLIHQNGWILTSSGPDGLFYETTKIALKYWEQIPRFKTFDEKYKITNVGFVKNKQSQYSLIMDSKQKLIDMKLFGKDLDALFMKPVKKFGQIIMKTMEQISDQMQQHFEQYNNLNDVNICCKGDVALIEDLKDDVEQMPEMFQRIFEGLSKTGFATQQHINICKSFIYQYFPILAGANNKIGVVFGDVDRVYVLKKIKLITKYFPKQQEILEFKDIFNRLYQLILQNTQLMKLGTEKYNQIIIEDDEHPDLIRFEIHLNWNSVAVTMLNAFCSHIKADDEQTSLTLIDWENDSINQEWIPVAKQFDDIIEWSDCIQ